ncbi:MAG: 2-oxoglutarate dehydrogenase E1 component [Deltaproteobacteria bacterium]|nr:2-oxoglutarate dehydrogenase E1 component [Deltaproteobacteria bacterium]
MQSYGEDDVTAGVSLLISDNAQFVEALYRQYQSDPASVGAEWQEYFAQLAPPAKALPLQRSNGVSAVSTATADIEQQARVLQLINAYRVRGHFDAHLDPLGIAPRRSHPELDPAYYGFTNEDLGKEFPLARLFGMPALTLKGILSTLRETYCGSIGVEFRHMQDPDERRWIVERMEDKRHHQELSLDTKRTILSRLYAAETFEVFLHTKFVGHKRFSLEGAEVLIPLLDIMIERCAELGVEEIVLGMPHRGRLNVLANTLGKSFEAIFSEFEGNVDPSFMMGSGDVKYHLGFSSDYRTSTGKLVHVSLTANPSHLEAVNPVVEGRVRAKQEREDDVERSRIVPLLIHGNAAFAGQGVVAETLNLTGLRGYTTGGTIHVIVNNQIGFTTEPEDAHSGPYASDIAKAIQAPIFHVNGEDPEAVARVTRLAVEYRQTFKHDVVIDIFCYRRYGHNEGDEPSFTQPRMYRAIKGHPHITWLYRERLLDRREITVEEAHAIEQSFRQRLQTALNTVKSDPRTSPPEVFGGAWEGFTRSHDCQVDTRVKRELLEYMARRLSAAPEDFTVNPKVEKLLQARTEAILHDRPIDWGLAEILAYGSLLCEGVQVRLSGQDCERGTFSHRHAVLVDFDTGARYAPLSHMHEGQARFRVYNSSLSEYGVLGFEFGYSLDAPQTLTLWEAQFGDFANGAQIVIDQFLASAEAKWQRMSGLVLLLPHGYEGQGPEHSSARLERYLQLCAEDNLQVVSCTTPAQIFHLLRRQMKRNFRKPLVVMTPKSLLRHKLAVSSVTDLAEGRFQEVIDEATLDPQRVTRLLFCSGKVYYDLLAEREQRQLMDTAIVRLEQLYPFPRKALTEVLCRYPKARTVAWVQEEPRNMGAWGFMREYLSELLPLPLRYVGRRAQASPAVGAQKIHQQEQAALVEHALTMNAER